jgi:hypothetical protein
MPNSLGPTNRDLAARLVIPLRESAVTVERAELRESVVRAISEAPATGAGPLLVDMQIISAGWNRAGTRYYPADVLVRDVPTVLGKGTHVHLDHPSISEAVERPERSLQTLAAVIDETPYTPDGGKTMRAKVKVFSAYAPFIREAWENIGVSINADGEGVYGAREGRKGLIVESISVGKSVDFVTSAGAGGRIVSLLESAREAARREASEPAPQPVELREARNVGAWLESRLHLALTTFADDMYGDGRLTREERITLSAAIGDGLQAWSARVEADAPQLFQRSPWECPETAAAIAEAFRGPEPPSTAEVEPDAHAAGGGETPAEDVTDGTAPTAPNPPQREEHPMSGSTTGPAPGTAGTAEVAPAIETVNIQAQEADRARAAAEQARDVALREAAEAKTELQRFRAVEAARPIAAVALAESGLPPAAQARVLASVERRVPLTESGTFDEAAFKTLVEAEATAEKTYLASLAEADGAGRVTGFGQPVATATDTASASSWATPTTPVNTALVEAYKSRGLTAEAATAAARGRAI